MWKRGGSLGNVTGDFECPEALCSPVSRKFPLFPFLLCLYKNSLQGSQSNHDP